MQEMELFEMFISEYAKEFETWCGEQFGIEPYGYGSSSQEFIIKLPLFSSEELGWGTLERRFVIDSYRPLNSFIDIGATILACQNEFENDARREIWADNVYYDLVCEVEPVVYLNAVSLHQQLLDEGFAEEEISDFYGPFKGSNRGWEIRQMIEYAINEAYTNLPNLLDFYVACRADFFNRNGLGFDNYGNVVFIDY